MATGISNEPWFLTTEGVELKSHLWFVALKYLFYGHVYESAPSLEESCLQTLEAPGRFLSLVSATPTGQSKPWLLASKRTLLPATHPPASGVRAARWCPDPHALPPGRGWPEARPWGARELGPRVVANSRRSLCPGPCFRSARTRVEHSGVVLEALANAAE